MKLKVAIDFDDCLDQEEVQQYASDLIDRGIEVWICTARMDNEFGNPNWNDDVWFMCNRIGISITNTIFTNGSSKSHYLNGKGFLWLLDDMGSNIEDLNKNSEVIPILYASYNDWRKKCDNIIIKILNETENKL